MNARPLLALLLIGCSSSGAGVMGDDGGGDPMDPVDPGTPPPEDFWDATGVPAAQNVMTFKFLNRTLGAFSDAEVYWRFRNTQLGIDELHSIAEQPTYDMPANASGRMYFYICATDDAVCASDPSKSKYFDFIEHTIGADRYNGNTTRVDALGLPLAMRMHAHDGWERTVGDTYETFTMSRDALFQQFVDEAPAEFKALAQPPNAPYRIVSPGSGASSGGFGEGGANAAYYDSFVDELWTANALTVPRPGPNGSGLGSFPSLSAAIYRHVGAEAGTFAPDGKLMNTTLWDDPTTFYRSTPSDFYARFCHEHGIDGKAYGFPYDDVGSYSTYISHDDPEYMLVAIGW